jgi:hypothetical protein
MKRWRSAGAQARAVGGFAIETISEELCPSEEKSPQKGRKTLTKKRRVFSYTSI